MIVNKGKASNTTKKLLWGFFFSSFVFFFFSAFFAWPFPWCVKVSFYADHNENGTLALPLIPSLYLPPLHWVGMTNLNYGQTKKINK